MTGTDPSPTPLTVRELLDLDREHFGASLALAAMDIGRLMSLEDLLVTAIDQMAGLPDFAQKRIRIDHLRQRVNLMIRSRLAKSAYSHLLDQAV